MANSNEKYLKWLSTHPAEEAWKRIVEDTNVTIGTAVDPEKFLKNLSPLPYFNDRTEVCRWLNFILPKIDQGMSVEEAKVLHICCDTLAASFKKAA
jgi:hypothetical protein